MYFLRRAGGAIKTRTTRRYNKHVEKSFEDRYFAGPGIKITYAAAARTSAASMDAGSAERLRDSLDEQNTQLSDQETQLKLLRTRIIYEDNVSRK